jgi:hypothetical protein
MDNPAGVAGDANLNSFACTANSGWNGTGNITNPYRLEFDGSSDYVQVPDSTTSTTLRPSDVTVCAWVKLNSQRSARTCNTNVDPNYQYIVFKQNNRRDGFEGFALVKGQSGGFAFQVTSSTGTQGAGGGYTTTTVGSWYYACGSFGGRTIRVYVNGKLENSSDHPFSLDLSTRPVYVGRSGQCGQSSTDANWDSFFNGAISDVQIYNRVLSDAEIYRNCQASEGKFIDRTTTSLCRQ